MKSLLPILCLLLSACAQAGPPAVAIRNVTVVDVTDGSLHADQMVVVVGNRITAVGPADEVGVPDDAEVIDAPRGYLIPGLWDMHTHLLWSTDATEHYWTEMPHGVDSWTPWERHYGPSLNLMIASGVTGIRDMWGDLEVARRVRREVENGERLAPRMVVAGQHLTGQYATYPGQLAVTNPQEGLEVVDSLKAAGADFIKVHNKLDPAVYFAIAKRSIEMDIPVAGHVPWLVSAAAASEAGQRSFEHLVGMVEGCSSDESNLIALNRRILSAAGETADSLNGLYVRRALATQSDARCRELLRRLARNRTWQVPTFMTLHAEAYQNDWAKATDGRLRYIHPDILHSWSEEEASPEKFQRLQRLYQRKVEITGMMDEEGVPILAGTDTPGGMNNVPGFGLHDELQLLVEAGLTPLQALQAATLEPARFFEATDSLGTIEAGKLADLVLLNANPLEDITNTRQIRAVVADGHLYRRANLDRILADVEESLLASTRSSASSSAPASHECIHRNEAVTDSLGRAIVNATGVILIDSAATAPRIDVGGEPCLVLPPEYAAAVVAHDPEFEPWNTRPFPTWIFTDETVTARQTPFAVIGDLTGNGGADVVIDGHSDGYASRLILLRNGNEVRVVEHYRRPLPVVPSVYREGFSEAIHLVPPGRYESFFEEEALELENFAFEWLFLEKAAVIVYWRGGEFQEWVSAD